MHKRMDLIRAILAWLVGLAAVALALYAIATCASRRWAGASWLYQQIGSGRFVPELMVAVGASAGLTWLYAAWFDELLPGGAVVRGIKFGVISWVWALTILLLLAGLGLASMPWAQSAYLALGLLGTLLVFGLAIGLVYGAGRQYDEYYFGLGYGLCSRC